MGFQHISECLPAELSAMLGIDGDGRGSSDKRAPAPAHAAMLRSEFVATDAGEGETPVAFARQGEVTRAQTENGENGGATECSPAKLGGGNKEPTRIAPRVMPASTGTAAGMSMITVHRRNRSTPHAPAVVIDMFAWKAARGHFAGTAEQFAL